MGPAARHGSQHKQLLLLTWAQGHRDADLLERRRESDDVSVEGAGEALVPHAVDLRRSIRSGRGRTVASVGLQHPHQCLSDACTRRRSSPRSPSQDRCAGASTTMRQSGSTPTPQGCNCQCRPRRTRSSGCSTSSSCPLTRLGRRYRTC